MVIAMEDYMGNTANLLTQQGHMVVPLYGYNGPIDIMIYRNDTIEGLVALYDDFEDESGVFMICERNLLPEEVLKIVEKKSYGGGNIFSF